MNNRRELTIKQKEILEFIDTYQKEHKVIPTLVEMSQKFGVSIAAIQHRLSALMRKKVLVRKNIFEISASSDVGALPERREEIGNSGARPDMPLL